MSSVTFHLRTTTRQHPPQGATGSRHQETMGKASTTTTHKTQWSPPVDTTLKRLQAPPEGTMLGCHLQVPHWGASIGCHLQAQLPECHLQESCTTYLQYTSDHRMEGISMLTQATDRVVCGDQGNIRVWLQLSYTRRYWVYLEYWSIHITSKPITYQVKLITYSQTTTQFGICIIIYLIISYIFEKVYISIYDMPWERVIQGVAHWGMTKVSEWVSFTFTQIHITKWCCYYLLYHSCISAKYYSTGAIHNKRM